MDGKTIFVAGCGLMGSGIAQVCAQSGHRVIVMDADTAKLDKAAESIAWSVAKLVEKGKISGDAATILGRISYTASLAEAASAEVVIEAVFENPEVKREVFAQLEPFCSRNALLASNTSAIPITELGSALKYPDRFLGMHFFAPVAFMQAVEIIRGMATSQETMDRAATLVESLGKTPVRVRSDIAGFVINRVNMPSSVEAIRLVETGVAAVDEVDAGMRLGYGRPMGPLETQDMSGLDVALNALTQVYRETGDSKFKPPTLLQRKVAAGHLGRKTGIGWYCYDENGKKLGPAV